MERSPMVFAATVIFMLPAISAAQVGNEHQQQAKQVLLWAGISVPQPIFGENAAKKLQMSFAVYNDGTSTVDPKIGASHLSINRAEPKDWLIVINNGLRTTDFEALPSGHVLSFGYLLGDRYFAKPGIYTVRWWGDNFKAQPITFRVIPDSR